MLVADNLFKNYSSLAVVNGVSLNIAKGEIVSVTGPSGAGKSTLLHLLGALDKPDSGSVLIDSTDVFKLSAKKQARFRNKHIGFVFQFHHLLPEFSAVENVAVPLWIAGKGKKQALAEAAEVLGTVGLAHKLENKPAELSGGEQQRVAIARALVNEPVMILADEATGNLDTRTSYGIMALMQELNTTQNKTIVFVTHEPDIATFSSRTLTLKDGRLVKDSKNENVRSAKNVLQSLPTGDDY